MLQMILTQSFCNHAMIEHTFETSYLFEGKSGTVANKIISDY